MISLLIKTSLLDKNKENQSKKLQKQRYCEFFKTQYSTKTGNTFKLKQITTATRRAVMKFSLLYWKKYSYNLFNN